MILSDRDIKRLVKSGHLIIDPLSEDTIRENGLDLRIGYEYAVIKSNSQPLDTLDPDPLQHYYEVHTVKEDEPILIKPHQQLLLTTLETIKLPSAIAGICCLRSTFARLGCFIPPTIIDAGFHGQLTIELIGGSFPLKLYAKQRFLHVVLHKLSSPTETPYKGKYQNQKGLTIPILKEVVENES